MRAPGEWQTYDVIWTAPRFKADGSLESPAYVTAMHNGVLVQDKVVMNGGATSGTIGLQDHYTPVRFRNIWVQRLEGEGKK